MDGLRRVREVERKEGVALGRTDVGVRSYIVQKTKLKAGPLSTRLYIYKSLQNALGNSRALWKELGGTRY